jgi:hypothetical protein
VIEIQHLAPQTTARRHAAYRDLLTFAQATNEYATCALAHVDLLLTRASSRALPWSAYKYHYWFCETNFNSI